MPQTRPDYFPDLDTASSNSATLPIAEAVNGFPTGAALPAAKLNALGGEAARWLHWLDERAVIIPEIAGQSACVSLEDAISYPVGSGSLTTAAATGGIYLWRGVRLDLRLSKLALYGLNSVTWVATRDNYVFIDDEYTVTYIDVPVGDPAPATPANSFEIGHARTDGTEIVFWFDGGAPLAFLVERNLRARPDGNGLGRLEVQTEATDSEPGEMRFLDSDGNTQGRLRCALTSEAPAKVALEAQTTPVLTATPTRVVTLVDSDVVGATRGLQTAPGDFDLLTDGNYHHEGTRVLDIDANANGNLRVTHSTGLADGWAVGGIIQVVVTARADASACSSWVLTLVARNSGGITYTLAERHETNDGGATYSSTTFSISVVGTALELQVGIPNPADDARVVVYWGLTYCKSDL